MSGTTPLLQQYFAIKQRHADALVFFQVGDFYELFFDDAKQASAFLGITLTKRGTHNNEPVPLAGVPVHTIEHYVAKLVRGGFRVVMCDQLEPARAGKVVERGVAKVLTPGTLTDSALLPEKSASYCAVIHEIDGMHGLVFVEILTGQIFVTAIPVSDQVTLEGELRRFMPDEIIIAPEAKDKPIDRRIRQLGFVASLGELSHSTAEFTDWCARCEIPARVLLERSTAAQHALCLLHGYLKKNQERALAHCTAVAWYHPDDYVMLDAATQRNLELVRNAFDGSTEHTLYSVLDRAATSMGSRMIKKWITRPLVRKASIEQRLDAVHLLVHNAPLREQMQERLCAIGDIERVVGRIALRRALVQDYRALAMTLPTIADLREVCVTVAHETIFKRATEAIGDFSQMHDVLIRAVGQEQGAEYTICPGYDAELDRLRMLSNDGARLLADIERREQERTGIPSLKIRYSRVQGYALEVTNTHRELVPDHYIRLQTLVNRERYTTPELKEAEYDIIRAQKDAVALEESLYQEVRATVEQHVIELKKMANALAYLDAVLGYAYAAYDNGYVRPQIHDGREIIIHEGRHPVVALARGHEFIPNDTQLTDTARTWIITGPNMGGKSTYLRQVALIVVMAHAGSFVPAIAAQIPLVDRIFTRIGASDHVAAGKSTFLMEMEETAIICNNATEKSLVILDEVGRGTSTYDGLSIAQAVLEYIHEHIHARALFATHYHELTTLTETHPGIVSYHAASSATPNGLVLLYKISPGAAEGSFGLEVARMVNLPPVIVARAEAILDGLHAVIR